jgi:hypothetical protein
VKEFIDETAESEGTPINRKNMMAIQGFIGNRVTFEDNKVIQTNSEGHRLETTFNEDGSVTEVFVGEKTITKTIYFNEDRSITEVIS